MSQQNEQVIMALIDALNQGDLDLVERLTHPDFFNHEAVASRANGPAGARATIALLRESFAGFRFEPLDVILGGDRAVVRARVSGRHVGEFAGMAPTGEEFSAEHIHIWRLAEGKVIEHWACRDDIGTMRQLGLLPEPAGAST